MNEYFVNTDKLELPRYTSFKAVCKFPYETGTLIVFKIGQRIGIGRWLPNIGGFNWILLPGKLICLVGCAIKIIGQVVVSSNPQWN